MSGETLERARNRWREILPLLGIDTRFLINKHGPCPLCGGKDRFRFTDRTGNGDYYCHQCHAGVGLTLVRKKNGWDFKTAAAEIDNILGRAPQQPTSPRPAPEADAARRLKRIKQSLAEATDDRIVESFLRHRHLEVSSTALRGHTALPYFQENQMVGRFPAVLAPVISPEDSTVTATALYCAGAPEPRKKFLPVTSTINGAAVRLWEPEESRLGVAEGIATAMAARQLYGVPTWAALSANGLRTFAPPQGINHVTVFADNDSNYVGQAAAYDLAQRLVRDGLKVDVRELGTDFADLLPRQERR